MLALIYAETKATKGPTHCLRKIKIIATEASPWPLDLKAKAFHPEAKKTLNLKQSDRVKYQTKFYLTTKFWHEWATCTSD